MTKDEWYRQLFERLDNDINNWIHHYAYKLAVGSSITVIVFIYRGVLWETNQVNGLCMA